MSERAERTGCLIPENVGSSTHLGPGRQRRGAFIRYLFQCRARFMNQTKHRANYVRRFGYRSRQMSDERAGSQILIAAALRVADDDLRCARHEPFRQTTGELEFAVRRGVRQAVSALQLYGNERIRSRLVGPGGIMQPRDPQAVELEARGLEQSHDLDRDLRHPGLKDAFTGHAHERRERLGVTHPVRDLIKG